MSRLQNTRDFSVCQKITITPKQTLVTHADFFNHHHSRSCHILTITKYNFPHKTTTRCYPLPLRQWVQHSIRTSDSYQLSYLPALNHISLAINAITLHPNCYRHRCRVLLLLIKVCKLKWLEPLLTTWIIYFACLLFFRRLIKHEHSLNTH